MQFQKKKSALNIATTETPVWYNIKKSAGVDSKNFGSPPHTSSNSAVQCSARSQNCEKQILASSCLSVRPSISPHGTTRLPSRTDFHEIWYLRILRKYAGDIQVSLRSGTNNWYFRRTLIYVYDISLKSS